MRTIRKTRLPGTPEPGRYFSGKHDLQIAADCWGDANKQPVILLHGGGQTRHAWKGTGKKLADAGYYAVAFDCRGHGDSDWCARRDYDEQAMVEDLARVANQISHQPPVLVGASMGGLMSLLALANQQLQAAALVLVDIVPQIEPEGAERIREFMEARPDGFASLEEVAAAISAYQPQRKPTNNLQGLAKNVRQGSDGRYYWHWDPAWLEGKQGNNIQEVNASLEEAARQITIPMLLVRGGLSDIVSDAGAQAFLALCPQAQYENISGAAHMIAGDRNDIFAQAVLDFINQLPSP